MVATSSDDHPVRCEIDEPNEESALWALERRLLCRDRSGVKVCPYEAGGSGPDGAPIDQRARRERSSCQEDHLLMVRDLLDIKQAALYASEEKHVALFSVPPRLIAGKLI